MACFPNTCVCQSKLCLPLSLRTYKQRLFINVEKYGENMFANKVVIEAALAIGATDSVTVAESWVGGPFHKCMNAYIIY